MNAETEQPQHLRALAKANWTRSQRAALKQALKDGTVDWRLLLRGNSSEWEEVACAMQLTALLDAIPKVGPVTAEECIAYLGLRGRQLRLADVSYGRREQLALALEQALAGLPLEQLNAAGEAP